MHPVKKGILAAVVCSASMIACASQAHAETISWTSDGPFMSVYVTPGGPAPTAFTGGLTIAGGPLQNVTYTGLSLAQVYCVDLDHFTGPGTYDSTHNSSGVSNNQVPNFTVGSPSAAGQVAWLMNHFAAAAAGNTALEAGLQAAIWKTIYGAYFTLTDSNPAYQAAYAADLAALGSNEDSFHSVWWLNPTSDSGNTLQQGFVGIPGPPPQNGGSVPEPASMALVGIAASALAGFGWLRRKAVRV